MKAIMAALLAILAAQDKTKARLLPRAPTEDLWPVGGAINRADETLLQIFATRLERRWDARIEKFRECRSSEFRVWGRALVSKGSFDATLPRSAPGFYRLSIGEEGRELYAERLFMGRPEELTAGWAERAERLEECRGRLSTLLERAETISQRKAAPPVGAKKDFLNSLAKEDSFLEETARRSDFTATPFVLRQVVYHLRNAQIWAPRAVDDAEGKFLDPALTFPGLESAVAGAKKIRQAELGLSVASLLAELLRRKGDSAAKWSGVRRAATSALKILDRMAEAESDLGSAIRAAAGVDERIAEDVRSKLEACMGNLSE